MAEIALYDYQVASVEALRERIRAGVKNIILSAATGSGKTIISAYMLNEVRAKMRRAVFVVDRITLVNQTSRVLDHYGIPHGVIQGNHFRARPWERIQIASAQTLDKRDWPETDIIFVDECHTQRKAVLDRISARDCIAIGLTATPFSKGLGKHYDAVVTVTTTNKLIEDKFLSKYRIFAASEPDMTGAKTVAGEWTDAEASERSMPIVGDCVTEYLKHGNEKKFIAFGVDVRHCEELQRQFMAAGVQCALYTFHTSPDECEQIVQEFRKPDSYIKGLISVSKLSRGFDVADVEVIILARPLKSSLAEHIQMIGRGLRSHPGKEICTILDHAGNCGRFWDEMNEFFECGASELDDGKVKEKPKKTLKEPEFRKCPKCASLHKIRPSCPQCGFEYPKRPAIAHEAGELKEMGGGTSVSRDEKQDIWSQLLYVVRVRGYKPGFASWKYKERFGVFPRGLNDVEKEPSAKLLNWLRSRQIAYAKANKSESIRSSA